MKPVRRIEREGTVESELKWARKLAVALQATGAFVLCVALSLALPVLYLQSSHSQQHVSATDVLQKGSPAKYI